MEQRKPLMYSLCKSVFNNNVGDAFSVSTMLNYFITSDKFEDGEKYVLLLKITEENKIRMIKALWSYKHSC